MAKCRKLSVDELAKKLAAEKGRKLTADEKAGLKILPPQFVCDANVSTSAPSTSGQIGFPLGAYKPERTAGHSRLTSKAEARAKRSAKKASTRIARRAAKQSPEDAPVRRITRGYID